MTDPWTSPVPDEAQAMEPADIALRLDAYAELAEQSAEIRIVNGREFKVTHLSPERRGLGGDGIGFRRKTPRFHR